jgi:hypothetical protein
MASTTEPARVRRAAARPEQDHSESGDDQRATESELVMFDWLDALVGRERKSATGGRESVEYRRDVTGVKYVVIIVAQLIYLVTRSFLWAFPLSIAYELVTQFILAMRGVRYRVPLFLRLTWVFELVILDVFIQYVFDLTFFAGEIRYLYLVLVWMLLLIEYILLTPFWIKVAAPLTIAAVTAILYDWLIFSEPWVIVAFAANWLGAVGIMWAVYSIPEYAAVLVYIALWVAAILVYVYVFGIRNDSHSFSQYFN